MFRYVSMGFDRFWGSECFEVSMGSHRFRVPKVVPGFEGFGVPGFDGFCWVLTVSKVSGFDGVPKVPGP